MVVLPLPQGSFSRVRLLAHESFHRLQRDLKLYGPDPVNAHLDSESGRLWLRLELRALARALRTDGRAARAAAQDALLFRAMRNSLHPAEPAWRRSPPDWRRRSFCWRSFAGGWRKAIKRESWPAAFLTAAIGFRKPAGLEAAARLRAGEYGYRAVAAHERERETRHQALLAGYRLRFLEGPTLRFPKTPELNRVFNPNNLVGLGEHGTVYPTGTFASRWGKLYVEDVGALPAPDNQSLRVSAPQDPHARPLSGPGWKWTSRPAGPSARESERAISRSLRANRTRFRAELPIR